MLGFGSVGDLFAEVFFLSFVVVELDFEEFVALEVCFDGLDLFWGDALFAYLYLWV